MKREQLIKKYLDFFKSKHHNQIPNSPLIPEDDPTVLFTTAGMHPLVPYLLGQKHPQGKRLVNVQKCIRTTDIEEVGDTTHHTFFEMLGNWSFGDYFKKEAIEYSFEFLTKELKIPKSKISVTCFKGDKDAEKDTESSEIWKKLTISKIKFLPKEDNWWGPAGKTGPCGPDTEMFINNVEIWNNVFMQYNKQANGKYIPLKQKNVDTGMGVERTLAILNNLEDNYLTECWNPIIKQIEKISKKKYQGNEKAMRIIADHIKAACFLLNEKITPSNTEQGYVLRRLIRRAVVLGKDFKLENFTPKVAEPVFEIYKDYKLNKELIKKELEKEEKNFQKTLQKGINVLQKIIQGKKSIDRKSAFLLFQSYGFPIELTKEIAKEKNIQVDEMGFKIELEKHQKLSRTASQGKFKSGLADNSKETTKLHTATHLLNQALRKVLEKPDIYQKGSNITPERLRFDFNFDRKLTDEEIKKIEDWVNDKIKRDIPVEVKEMNIEQAKKIAKGVFESKYGDKVKVYTIRDCSTEICAGPHVTSTGQLSKFKIKKQESSSVGVRRIKAVLE